MKDSTNKAMLLILLTLAVSHYVTNYNVGVFHSQLRDAINTINLYQSTERLPGATYK